MTKKYTKEEIEKVILETGTKIVREYCEVDEADPMTLALVAAILGFYKSRLLKAFEIKEKKCHK